MKTKCILWALALSSLTASAATFRPDSLYSKWIIDSRMGNFNNKSNSIAFLTPTSNRSAGWDYVPGLVAKGILKAWEQYQDSTWSAYWFAGIQDYADNVTPAYGTSNIDDLNASKIFYELYRGASANGETAKAADYQAKATTARNTLKNTHTRIGSSLPGTGGFWHKNQYTNQMWLDGLYMGPAMYAEWQGVFGSSADTDWAESWADIALQFDTIFAHTWDSEKQLCYHAWSAEPTNSASSYWANATTGRSQEFWARGMGWFFAALIDVLEYMPAGIDVNAAGQDCRTRLMGYANSVAAGLAARQDATTGVWYQLLQYDGTLTSTCGINNYLESSASSMFTYAYLKGIRLNVLDSAAYMSMAQKAYRGLVEQFVTEETGGTIKLIQSCESAGLSGSRKGDANYYLCGSDVDINNNTEGKVFGPFIMASVEYEHVIGLNAGQETTTQTNSTNSAGMRYADGYLYNPTAELVQIYSSNGQQILHSQSADIDLRTLPNGIYIAVGNTQTIKMTIVR